jgi:hypothetical protein
LLPFTGQLERMVNSNHAGQNTTEFQNSHKIVTISTRLLSTCYKRIIGQKHPAGMAGA